MMNRIHPVAVPWLCVASVAFAQEPAHLDPGAYKVGYTQVIDVRPALPSGAPRPVILTIFYPVDPAQVTETTPRPDYWFAPGLDRRVLPSTAFDAYRYEPSYSGLAVAPGGPFPLVLYSHGYGGPWLTGIHLLPKVASHGYVVVAVTHEPPIPHEAVALKLREGDLRFALDRMLARTRTAGDLFEGTVDPERIGAMGFSFGGYSVTALVSGDADPCPNLMPDPPAWACTPAEPDPRVKVLVLLDPSTWVFDFADMTAVNVPVISIHKSHDALVAQGSWGAANARHHAAFTGTPNYRVDLERTNHPRFGAACEVLWQLWVHGWITEPARDAQRAARRCDDPELLPSWQVVHPLIAEYALAFLEAELGHRSGLQPILTPGHALTGESWVQFIVTEKISPRTPESAIHEFWYFPYQSGTNVERASRDVAGRRADDALATFD